MIEVDDDYLDKLHDKLALMRKLAGSSDKRADYWKKIAEGTDDTIIHQLKADLQFARAQNGALLAQYKALYLQNHTLEELGEEIKRNRLPNKELMAKYGTA